MSQRAWEEKIAADNQREDSDHDEDGDHELSSLYPKSKKNGFKTIALTMVISNCFSLSEPKA